MSDRTPVLLGIPTYNGAHRLDWLLKSIHLREEIPDMIIVVDDGSPVVQSTRNVVQGWSDRLPVRLIEHGSNRGISAAWNTATRAASERVSGGHVVLANDDVIMPSGGWLQSFQHVLDNSPGVGVVGMQWHAFTADDVGSLLAGRESDAHVVPRDPVSKEQVPSRRAQYEDTNPGRVMAPTGQLFAFRRQDFEAVGGFDETYKSFYEESDFGTSMCRWGKIGLQITWPFCWHMWSKTFSENAAALRPDERLRASREHYRRKWNVPEGVHEFDYTNPKYLGAVSAIAVEFRRRNGIGYGILRPDGAFIDHTDAFLASKQTGG